VNIEELLVPVSPESPAGEDVSSSIEFSRLMEARRRDRAGKCTEGWNPSSGLKHPEWQQAIDIAMDLIRNRSKDLTVAVYLAEAVAHVHGLPGLCRIIALIQGLLDTFWDDLHPEMESEHDVEYRIGALNLLSRLIDTWIQEANPAGDGLADLAAALTGLASVAKDRCRQPSIDLEDLAARLVRMSIPPAPQASASRVEPSTPEAAEPSFDAGSLGAWLLKMSRDALDDDPFSPLSFRLSRTAAWSFKELPSECDRPAPSAEDRDRIQSIVDHGRRWLECEKLFWRPEGRLWLDLQWHAFIAFTELGREYDAVKAVIREEVRGLVNRFPGLVDEKLADGTPVASPGCREWLLEVTVSPPAAPSASPASEDSDPGRLEEAAACVEKGDLPGALRRLDAGAPPPSGRTAFQLRNTLAEMMLAQGRKAAALLLFEDLLERADTHGLDVWEGPECVISLLENLISCSDRHAPAMEQERRRRWMARLCRLDAAGAMHHIEAVAS